MNKKMTCFQDCLNFIELLILKHSPYRRSRNTWLNQNIITITKIVINLYFVLNTSKYKICKFRKILQNKLFSLKELWLHGKDNNFA